MLNLNIKSNNSSDLFHKSLIATIIILSLSSCSEGAESDKSQFQEASSVNSSETSSLNSEQPVVTVNLATSQIVPSAAQSVVDAQVLSSELSSNLEIDRVEANIPELGLAVVTEPEAEYSTLSLDSEFGPTIDENGGLCPNVPTSFSKVHVVDSFAEFTQALADVNPGEAIKLTDGTKNWRATIPDSASGTSTEPVHILSLIHI